MEVLNMSHVSHEESLLSKRTLPQLEIIDEVQVEEFSRSTSDEEKSSIIKPPTLIELAFSLFLTSLSLFIRSLKSVSKTVFSYFVYHPSHATIIIALSLVISLLTITGTQLHEQLMLSRISEQSIDAIVLGSRFTREYTPETAFRRGTQEFLNVGAPEWMQREAIRAVLFQARRQGLSVIDQAVLLATVEIESGFNSMARAPSTSACGLFQFVRGTGQLFGLKHNECMDPNKNAEAGVLHYIQNYENSVADKVQHLTGPEKLFAVFENTYYLHHDGPFSSNPSPELKATVLSGVAFLFRAYEVLLEDEIRQQQTPSFMDSFSNEFWRIVDIVSVRLSALAS
jgi:hypothetical protein